VLPFGYISAVLSYENTEVNDVRVQTAKDLGNLIRERRQALQLTQQALAERAGVGRPWLVAVEAGHVRAEFGKVLGLVSALGMTLDLSVPTSKASGQVDLDALLGEYDAKRKRTHG
jgi:HTH-type transcriptional regulator / antitoxin HipB